MLSDRYIYSNMHTNVGDMDGKTCSKQRDGHLTYWDIHFDPSRSLDVKLKAIQRYDEVVRQRAQH